MITDDRKTMFLIECDFRHGTESSRVGFLHAPRLETFPAIPTIFLPYFWCEVETKRVGGSAARPSTAAGKAPLNDLSRDLQLLEWVGKFGPIAEQDEVG